MHVDGEKLELGSEAETNALLAELELAQYQVKKVKPSTRTRRPYAPFTTSSMQQDASRRLRYSARKTMRIAQQLYEGIELASGETVGLITYMRTDSTNVSETAQKEAREVVREKYGPEYVPTKPPQYRSKSRGAQEAHEAIRPTSVRRDPEAIKAYLSADQYKLYSLIWKRFVASQMKPAVYDTMTIEVIGTHLERSFLFRVTASALRFAGFLEVYEDQKKDNGYDQNGEDWEEQLLQLPDLRVDDEVNLVELFPEQHFTQPPARYSDAGLIRAMEDYGIGRPSTYAPIITTLRQRGYVERISRRLHPTEIGELVNDLIVDHFPNIVDLGFTARLEEDLDQIADGKVPWVEVVDEFYKPFEEQLEKARETMPEVKTEPEMLDRLCPESGHPLVIRHGRYGKFIGCSNFPECRYTEPWLEKIGVQCPQCGGDIVERRTRRGRIFYGCSNYPECDFTTWKRPLHQPCPECSGVLVAENKTHAQCLRCENRFERRSLEAIQAMGEGEP
jgi:DNA topoisomerase-1